MTQNLATITFLLYIKYMLTEIIHYTSIISLLNRGSNYFKGIYYKQNLQYSDGNYTLTLDFNILFYIVYVHNVKICIIITINTNIAVNIYTVYIISILRIIFEYIFIENFSYYLYWKYYIEIVSTQILNINN